MNRLKLTLQYPTWRWWSDHFIYFYTETERSGMDRYRLVCILNVQTDELVEDYRNKDENKTLVRLTP